MFHDIETYRSTVSLTATNSTGYTFSFLTIISTNTATTMMDRAAKTYSCFLSISIIITMTGKEIKTISSTYA
jgi:hypothetical protein